MKRYYNCKFCGNPIAGGDKVLHETGEHSHPLCYFEHKKKPKPNRFAYFHLFESLRK